MKAIAKILLPVLITLAVYSCVKEVTVAVVQTSAATSVTSTSAGGTGSITSAGGAEITEKGICWGTAPNPTVNNNVIKYGTGSASFNWSISGLSPGTIYYVKAYAINKAGTSYGNEINFTTEAVLATLTTTVASSITSSGAVTGGNISSDGGAAVTARGVCWATSQNPLITGSKTIDGTGSGSFTSTLTGLIPGTTYYVRSYATNSKGTTYGQEISFRTLSVLPTVTTADVTSVTSSGAQSGGTVADDGGETITAKGVCWSTSQNPTTSDFKTVNSFVEILGSNPFSGSDQISADAPGSSFISNITGLNPGTAYYVRAYATNSLGTSYGTQKSFTTLAVAPTVTTTAISGITSNGASSGGNVTSDGGAAVTVRGVCWGTSQNPTISGSKTSDGTGTGNFTSAVTGLNPGITYYVRAYATNSAGTSYGQQLSFTATAVTPTVTTSAINTITATGAAGGGNITSDGGSDITARGICWGTSQNPTISGSKTSDGTGTGNFTSTITGLSPGTTYYARAYATNSAGTAYGAQVTFVTLAVLPTVTTTSISNVASTSATSGGNITNDGGGAVTARGVCWSTSQNPTVADNKTNDGTGSGTFTSTVSGLVPGTLYYLRAYATNSAGTSYGNQITVNTSATTPSVTTNAVINITSSSATGGGNVTYDGGSAVTARGVCWNTTPNPTVANNKTTDGTGTGSFTSSITGLSPGVTYYVRAYATNSTGTVYGGEMLFATLAVLPSVSTTAVSAITSSGATSGGNVTSDGGASVSAKGVCWSTSQNPTVTDSKTTDGTGTGSYTSTISGLSSGVTYYVRAYATNGAGTAYGSQLSFTTTIPAPTVTTTSITSITSSSASGGGTVNASGGVTVTARGVCWATTQNPTISGSKTTDGSGTGTFSSSLSGLSAGTLYYVRAYATYSGGTVYGSQVSFTTIYDPPTVTTSSVGSITSSTVRTGGNVTADGGATVTARGVCWATTQNPTTSNSKTSNSTGTGSFDSYVSGLAPGTTYYLRAYATNSGGTSYGSQVSFTTAAASAYYEDGEYNVYQTNTQGTNPCEILILGDGYQSTDFATDGLFDQNANEAIEAFFAVEPYTTYRNYFKVYKMAAFSEDSGVTQTDLSITKKTVFSTQFTGGSSLEVDYTTVNNYAMTLPGMTSTKLNNLLIIVMINQNRYAGTCWMWSNGRAIALCPVSRQGSTANTKFPAIVNHEAGGHGWSRQADEYINYTGQTITTSQASTLTTWSGYGFYANVDLTNNLSTIKWSYFVGVTGYERVGAYEGAFYYSYGAWRSENTSCMINNIPYYSAPGREAAVKKIMSVSGGSYSLANFMANDIQKAPAAALLTKSFNPLTFVPLAPPVMMK
jgi:hypothetical protein